ncbi:MAG: diaminopropionate ammonia-lyase [Alphaproteobacteria bacterium]|nr:diaminopropionate ammonia-lyase [Alphaproteobacteria bacterium]
MFESFNSARLDHVAFDSRSGDAFETVLPRHAFETAIGEIRNWPGYAPTPLHHLSDLATRIDVASILYKDEGPRFGLGSFKALGGAYAAMRVLQGEISKNRAVSGCESKVSLAAIRDGHFADDAAHITLVSATDGNHGRSLAWGCGRFGAQCRIYIHSGVSEGRAEEIRRLGATVVRIEGDYDESVRLLREDARQNGWLIVSDTSWEGYTNPPRDVICGYGVMIEEITTELDAAPTHVFLQAGVGGMAASICAGFRQHWGDATPRVLIVEPDRAACLFASAVAGRTKSVHISEETVMAGLSCGEPSGVAWTILQEEARDFLTISDDVVAPAMRILAHPFGTDPRIEAGESAVAGLAAAIITARRSKMRQALGLDSSSVILVIGSEGVTDPVIHAGLIGAPDQV